MPPKAAKSLETTNSPSTFFFKPGPPLSLALSLLFCLIFFCFFLEKNFFLSCFMGLNRSRLRSSALFHSKPLFRRHLQSMNIFAMCMLFLLFIFPFGLFIYTDVQVYFPHLDSPPPRWVHFAHGLLLFFISGLYTLKLFLLYGLVTFDAVDGKQARRTNSSSPLGELFDHGISSFLFAIYIRSLYSYEIIIFGGSEILQGAMRLHVRSKPWPLGALLCVEGTVPGSGYFTNTLILPVVNGPTEGLALIYVMHFLTRFLVQKSI
ncbi:hypothetical protein Gotur_001176 [Gossypium turneri]